MPSSYEPLLPTSSKTLSFFQNGPTSYELFVNFRFQTLLLATNYFGPEQCIWEAAL